MPNWRRKTEERDGLGGKFACRLKPNFDGHIANVYDYSLELLGGLNLHELESEENCNNAVQQEESESDNNILRGDSDNSIESIKSEFVIIDHKVDKLKENKDHSLTKVNFIDASAKGLTSPSSSSNDDGVEII